MARGTVVIFNAGLGWGFIKSDSGGKDVFCHHTAINMRGYRKLTPGDVVEYDIENGRKGIEARNVRVVKNV